MQDVEFEYATGRGIYDDGTARVCFVKGKDGEWCKGKNGDKVLVPVSEFTKRPMPSHLRKLSLMAPATSGAAAKKKHNEARGWSWSSTGWSTGSVGWSWHGSVSDNGCGLEGSLNAFAASVSD